MQEPSFSNGFASPCYGGRIKYPGLWRGCVGAWSPLLGPTGATLFDQSGYSRHGTLTSMDTATDWVVGRYGYALDFDGTDDYVLLPSRVQLPGDFTLSMWFNSRDFGVKILLGDSSDADPLMGFLGFNTNVYWRGNGANLVGWTFAAMSTDTWYHLAITRQSGVLRSYINGLENASSYSDSTDYFFDSIAGYPTASFRFNGQLCDIAAFDRGFSTPEIRALAQRPGIMYELYDSDVWGTVEAGGSVPWWAFANRQSRIIGGGVT